MVCHAHLPDSRVVLPLVGLPHTAGTTSEDTPALIGRLLRDSSLCVQSCSRLRPCSLAMQPPRPATSPAPHTPDPHAPDPQPNTPARDDLNSPSSPKRVHSRIRVECDHSSSTSEAPVQPLPPTLPHPACAHTPPDIFSVAAHPPLARYAPTVEARPNQVLRVSTCRLSLKPGVRRRTSSHSTARYSTHHTAPHSLSCCCHPRTHLARLPTWQAGEWSTMGTQCLRLPLPRKERRPPPHAETTAEPLMRLPEVRRE